MPSITAKFPRGAYTWRVYTIDGERGPVAFLAFEDPSGIAGVTLDVLDEGEAQDLLEAARTAVELLRARSAREAQDRPDGWEDRVREPQPE